MEKGQKNTNRWQIVVIVAVWTFVAVHFIVNPQPISPYIVVLLVGGAGLTGIVLTANLIIHKRRKSNAESSNVPHDNCSPTSQHRTQQEFTKDTLDTEISSSVDDEKTYVAPDNKPPKPARPKFTISISKRLLYWLLGVAVSAGLVVGGFFIADSALKNAYNNGYKQGKNAGYSDGFETGYNSVKSAAQNSDILSVAELNSYIDKSITGSLGYSEYKIFRSQAPLVIIDMFPDATGKVINKYIELVFTNRTNKYPIEYFEDLGYTYAGNLGQ